MDQVIAEKPTALVLSGDITMNGEKINHKELAEKLHKVQDAGIPVLIIPGNHDINNPNAAVYFGDEKTSTDSVTPEEFYDIYHMYGYDQAISRDSASLSYVYQLDERNRLLMLDSCQYEPKNLVEGRIKAETLVWMDEQLKKAQEDGDADIAYCPITTCWPRAVCIQPSVPWTIMGRSLIFFRNIRSPCF